ncbi:hypothetical protein [Aliihoeflea sp. 40Bstr573]|uniref:hypothetical protein n=1 Tax=Aliihoeflea sp. 40Bstr573 TaxID=2696467 RepID=UPI0020963C59|nr:hypothetical protein [Aliihoeflea sp. 40Bstr573]MCO6386247.1 hypothetical protein [Aliihoeflea sp. 40Bstr573]
MRVVPPGYDVNSAPAHRFLLHESFLFAQPFFYQFVACPFAGFTGRDVRQESVNVPFPFVGNVPDIVVYPRLSNGLICFPGPLSEGAGTNADGFDVEAGYVSWSISASSLTLTFTKQTGARLSPQGAYVVLTRKAD